ncbi:MAG: bifunctional glutamate N-acetyltransferase/amino-acid acetyltransferase ArgJ [Cellvibrionales bacterium]|nr:bifunctional glutamate N-acetyltransferase/amino-acid acetyltransferase ArgJ [Cellvibrionales bacterium]
MAKAKTSLTVTEHPSILPVAGVQWGVSYAGIKASAVDADNTLQSETPKNDLALMALSAGTVLSGVFTRNAFSAAPVKIACQRMLAIANSTHQNPIYLLINSGNANAGTGAAGYAAAEESCQSLAAVAACDAAQVLPFSTGVIGQLLPVKCINIAAPAVWSQLSEDGWSQAASAIMTTDTVPKGFSRTLIIDDITITLSGICKGAGMIRPDMATMLAYVATDAAIAQADLDHLLQNAVQCSFNRITVDGDTSTNDACMLAATGVSSVTLSPSHKDWSVFQSALNDLFIDLSTSIIRDAEGATKFITINVNQGRDVEECLQVAYTVAESPLVKTAFFASDANWGRILAAVGRSGLVDLDVELVEIYLDDHLICDQGGTAKSYSEEAAMAIMAQTDITITINLQRGDIHQRVWTSDLSLDYVRINADYRT